MGNSVFDSKFLFSVFVSFPLNGRQVNRASRVKDLKEISAKIVGNFWFVEATQLEQPKQHGSDSMQKKLLKVKKTRSTDYFQLILRSVLYSGRAVQNSFQPIVYLQVNDWLKALQYWTTRRGLMFILMLHVKLFIVSSQICYFRTTAFDIPTGQFNQK